MSSQNLWVLYQTNAKPIIDLVPSEGCTYIAQFLNIIRQRPQFAISPTSQLTLYHPDGKTEIDVGESPTNYLNKNSRKNPLIVKTLSFPLNIVPTSINSPLIGQVFSVSINQSKLIKKYLTPIGSASTTPIENSPISVDISSLSLQLEQLIFYKNATARPCIVVDIQYDYDWTIIEAAPPITIVLITGFAGQPLDEVIAKEEFKRIMPICPTPFIPGTATPINTTPEWIPHTKRKVPSYVLCIPIKVYTQNLHRLEDSVQLDWQNLQKLKSHILALGGISANANFQDLEEDDSDDNDKVNCVDFNQIISWDEVVV